MNATLESSNLLNEDVVFPENENGLRRRLDFLGYAPCPLRNEMKQRLHRYFRSAAASEPRQPQWFIPSGCHSPNPYDELGLTTDLSRIPNLIGETGFGEFNTPAFQQRWIDTPAFASFDEDDIRPEFHSAGLVDPKGRHRVVSANVELILVDLKRLGDRPIPKTWADVLHPRFSRDIILSGEPGDIHESILYSLYKDHGESGLERLGANVKDFMHPAEMVKTAGSASPDGAALYLLPYFFAKSSPHQDKVRVIWPEEGAYLTPQYLLRKAVKSAEADLAEAYLTGPEWAAHLAKVGFAPARAGSPALGGKLRWIGWDFVRRHDLSELGAQLNAAFVRGHQSTP